MQFQVYFAVTRNGHSVAEGVLSPGERAAVTVEMPTTGNLRLLAFDQELVAFCSSPLLQARYPLELTEVITKFGNALQFTEEFVVHLKRVGSNSSP